MCEGFSVCSLGLRDFVFMMRENQIFAACMDVNFIPQILFAHDGALNVPARSAIAPRGFPERLALFFGLPEDKIQRIFLLVCTGNQQGTLAAL